MLARECVLCEFSANTLAYNLSIKLVTSQISFIDKYLFIFYFKYVNLFLRDWIFTGLGKINGDIVIK